MSALKKIVLLRGNKFTATVLIACTVAGNASGVIVPHKAGNRIVINKMSITPFFNTVADASGLSSDVSSQLAADVPILPNISLTIDAPANAAHVGVDWVYAALAAVAASPTTSKRLDVAWPGVGLVMGSPDDLQVTAGYRAASDVVTAGFLLQVNISGEYLPFVAGNTLNEQWLLPTFPDSPAGITQMGHVYVAEDYFAGTAVCEADPVTSLVSLFPRAYAVNPGTAAVVLASYAQAGLATDATGAPVAVKGVGTFDVCAQFVPSSGPTPPPTHLYQSLEAGAPVGVSSLDPVLGGLQLNPADILTIQATTEADYATGTDIYVWAQSFSGSFNQFGAAGTYI